MVITYTINDLNKIKSNEQFIKDYNDYINNKNYSNTLINSLKTSKCNKNIVNILTLLNTITKSNFNTNYIKIKSYIHLNKGDIDNIIKDIIKISINNSFYLDYYIIILKDIFSTINTDYTDIIQEYFYILNNEKYKNTNDNNISDEYDNLCYNNKITNTILNYSKLIIKLEQNSIISTGYISIIVDKLIEKCNNNIMYNDILYNYLILLYDILLIIDIDKDLNIDLNLLFNKLLNNTISKKNMFKIYDIIDLFKK